MYQKKNMRTVIINGKWIKRLVLGFILICVVGMIITLSGMVVKMFEISGNAGVEIISKSINGKKIDFTDMGEKLVGFDIHNEKTILYKYCSLFGELDNYQTVIESPPMDSVSESVETEKAIEEYDIDEINIAKGMEISNLVGIDINPDALANEKLHIKIDEKGPQILIVHTHTTESFTESGKTKYSVDDSDRSTDNDKNMVAVGEVIKKYLEDEGIEVIHDTTVHDYPSYSGAYTRSMTTVKNNLEKYPSIKVVLDVHRDGIIREDGTKVKVVAEVEEEKVAQCMFVIGSDAKLTHNNWKENMKFACKLQKYANINYPGLMRPIILRKERFNQQVSTGAIIIEIGSNGNTLEEAKSGAKYMAKIISAVLKEE